MEQNRLNIQVTKPPTVIFTNGGNSFVQEMNIGDKGQAEVEFEVVGTRLEADEYDNEIIKYTLKIVKTSKFDPLKKRLK